jgi:hypothetical protein
VPWPVRGVDHVGLMHGKRLERWSSGGPGYRVLVSVGGATDDLEGTILTFKALKLSRHPSAVVVSAISVTTRFVVRRVKMSWPVATAAQRM